MKNSIAILITVFNRKEKTLACLRSVYAQGHITDYDVNIFVVDGGSKDGTPEAIKSEFPDVHVSVHNGLYWAGGMRQAWRDALTYRDGYDYFWLLNDDTMLYDICLESLIEMEREVPDGIYVGATFDPMTKKCSYSGIQLFNRDFSKGIRIIPNGHCQDLDMANANIMLVTRHAYGILGPLCSVYTHGIADYDYTLRAHDKGIRVVLSPGYCGDCLYDHGDNWLLQSTSLNARISYLFSPKGLAYDEYLHWIKVFFPKEFHRARFKLWLKTLFPIIWQCLK